MGKSQLTLEETREMFIYLSQKMEESKDLLTQADKAIGDGDHGIGMARGFEAVRQKLESQKPASMDEVLKGIGLSLLTSIGGAAGAIFATLFRGGAKSLSGQQIFDSTALSLMLVDGLQAVKERGKAKPGDKTMVDSLAPAAIKSKEMVSAPLAEALKAVAEAARQGMEKTKELVATTGKAKTLGERSLGHPDPGAVSTYLILKFMAEYVS
ncbi:MAG: dihydroxyacetone kinase subunit DhaL [Thermodesulfobacteriota bacterium]|jgi:dihydroxyacetone kinase-like protein